MLPRARPGDRVCERSHLLGREGRLVVKTGGCRVSSLEGQRGV